MPSPCHLLIETSIDIAPDGIRFASSIQGIGVAPIPGGGAAATGSALLLGGAPLPFPLLPSLAYAVGGKTTSALLTSCRPIVRRLMVFLAMLRRRVRRGGGAASRRRRVRAGGGRGAAGRCAARGRSTSGRSAGRRAAGRRAAGRRAAGRRPRADGVHRLSEALVIVTIAVFRSANG